MLKAPLLLYQSFIYRFRDVFVGPIMVLRLSFAIIGAVITLARLFYFIVLDSLLVLWTKSSLFVINGGILSDN